jgi:hypothetical protein
VEITTNNVEVSNCQTWIVTFGGTYEQKTIATAEAKIAQAAQLTEEKLTKAA